MNSITPALVTLFLMGLGSILSRYASRGESRSVGAALGGLALVAAIASAFVDLESSTNSAFGGLLLLDSATDSMLPTLAAMALGLVLGMPINESGHRTVSQSLGLPALALASLLVNQLGTIVLLDILIAAVAIRATTPRARRVQGAVRFTGIGFVLAGLVRLPFAQWFGPLDEAAAGIDGVAAILMVIGVALQIGVGPGSLALRAAFCDGLTGRGILSALPFGGMALLLRVAGSAFGRSASHGETHLALLALFVCALLTVSMVLIQKSASQALALLISTVNAIAMAGLIGSDLGASVGGELLWAATLLAGTGLALALLALHARHGRLPIVRFSGFYRDSRQLGALVLFFALALGGLPGTLTFAAVDLVLHGDASGHLDTLVIGAIAVAVTGYASVQLAFKLLFGPPAYGGSVDGMPLLGRERWALLPMALLLLVAGIFPSLIPVVRQAPWDADAAHEASIDRASLPPAEAPTSLSSGSSVRP